MDSCRFWRSSLLSREPNLVHGATQVPMNMALTVGGDSDDTVARRRAACAALSLPFDRLTVAEQVHGDRVAVVMGERIGCGRDRTETRLPGVDGLVTDEPDVPLMALGADCGLIVIYDPERRAVAVGHAGWRGTAKRLVYALVRHLTAAYGCRCETLVATIGPCAGVCCYEVKEDVVATFAAGGHDTATFVDIRGGAMYLDVARANALQLEACGLRREKIDVAGVCTICSDAFYSHRRAPGAGHFGMIVAITER